MSGSSFIVSCLFLVGKMPGVDWNPFVTMFAFVVAVASFFGNVGFLEQLEIRYWLSNW